MLRPSLRAVARAASSTSSPAALVTRRRGLATSAPAVATKASPIAKLAVVGAGQMGTGIALVAAAKSRIPVLISDVSQKQLDGALKFADQLFAKDVAKGKMTADDSAAARARITTTTQLEQIAASSPDMVIEAATENLDLKLRIFAQLCRECPPATLLASNTSSISITKIAAATKRPQQVIGMHFFSPVPVMPIVEIIKGLQTSPATLQTTLDLAASMGKTTTTSADLPGFIANRVLMPYINEAILVLQEGIATREDIDTTMKLGTAVPMGPLTLADFIGLDTCLSIMQVLHRGFGDSKYRPAPLLQQYVDAGLLGKKSGRGFYDYPAKK